MPYPPPSAPRWYPLPAPASPDSGASPPPPVPAPGPDLLATPDEPTHHGQPPRDGRATRLRRKLSALGAAVLALLAKLKTVLLLLPKIKLLVTAGTMLVSIAAYATIWGFQFAVGFVVLLLVHEMGHVIALRREGIRATPPMFVPFLGAVISARSLGEDAAAEARVGLAGPILGSVGAAACVLLYHATGNDIWRALAFTGFFLNLFNLMPVIPLDGGRAMAAMSPWMWAVGVAGMVALVFVLHSAFVLIFAVIGGYASYSRWQQIRHGGPEQDAYYRVRPLDRLLVAAVYLSLIALLVAGMNATHLPRTLS